jgi:uncharacterized protein YecT (DUF1311 family)
MSKIRLPAEELDAMKPLALLVGSLFLLPSISIVSYAQSADSSQVDCTQATTPAEISICTQKQAAAAQQRLNALYGKVEADLTDRLRQADNSQINNVKQQYQKLVTEQKSWLATREKTCQAERDRAASGPIAQRVYHSCLVKLTDKRIADLEQYRQQHLPQK